MPNEIIVKEHYSALFHCNATNADLWFYVHKSGNVTNFLYPLTPINLMINIDDVTNTLEVFNVVKENEGYYGCWWVDNSIDKEGVSRSLLYVSSKYNF